MRIAFAFPLPLLLASTLFAAEPTVTPIGLFLGSEVGGALPFELKPMNLETGYKLHLLISGRDIAQFKDDSLVLTEVIDSEGVNRAKNRKGEAAYEMGSFPEVNEEGTKAVFSIEGAADLLGRSDGLKVTGSITLLLGSEVIEGKSEPLPAAGPGSATINGFTVTTGKPAEGMSFFGNSDDQTSVVVKGPLDSIVSFAVTRDGNELDQGGSMGGDDNRTYFFDGKPEGQLVVTIRSWKDLKEQVVPIAVTLK
jgi:hypothetical protein